MLIRDVKSPTCFKNCLRNLFLFPNSGKQQRRVSFMILTVHINAATN